MTDYSLTAGQQQDLIDFLNAGSSIYIEGNDFGYYHKSNPVYSMFGATYVGDGNATGNVQNLAGEDDTLMSGAQQIAYTYGSAYPDQYVDYITANGGDLIFKSQEQRNRAVSYAGPNGTYRAIYATFWFGAMHDSGATCNKAMIMVAYMRYLMGDTMVVSVANEISVTAGGTADLLLEADATYAGRTYAVLGSLSGTTPGFNFGSAHIPLNMDAVFNFIRTHWNSAMLANFQATLDASGRAVATLNTMGPLNPAYAGKTLNFAWIAMNPVDYASNPSPLKFVP